MHNDNCSSIPLTGGDLLLLKSERESVKKPHDLTKRSYGGYNAMISMHEVHALKSQQIDINGTRKLHK